MIKLTTAIVSLATTVLAWEIFGPKRNGSIPEGSICWPFIGHTPDMLKYAKDRKSHVRNQKIKKEKGSIHRTQLIGGMHWVVVSDAQAVKQVFCSPDVLRRSDFVMPLSKGIFLTGLFIMPTDDLWKKHRKAIVKSLGPSHVRNSVGIVNGVMDRLFAIWIQRLKELGDEYVSDMYIVASSITVDVIGLVAFSFDYESIKNHENTDQMVKFKLLEETFIKFRNPIQEAMKAYQYAFEVINLRSTIPEVLWPLTGVSTPTVIEKLKPLRDTIQRTIDNKRHNKKNEDKSLDDVLDRLLESDEWTDEEITDEVIALFLAGGETTANILTFCVLHLDQSPEVREKMVAEIDAVLGDSQVVTIDDINNLKYMECVVKEILRLYPAVPIPVGREALEDIEILGHVVKKGTIVFTDLTGVQRDPTYWKYPDIFSPSRWVDFTPAPGTYMPFGDGPHSCIGNRLAMIEIKTFLARLYQRFVPSVVPEQNLEICTSVTMGLKNVKGAGFADIVFRTVSSTQLSIATHFHTNEKQEQYLELGFNESIANEFNFNIYTPPSNIDGCTVAFVEVSLPSVITNELDVDISGHNILIHADVPSIRFKNFNVGCNQLWGTLERTIVNGIFSVKTTSGYLGLSTVKLAEGYLKGGGLVVDLQQTVIDSATFDLNGGRMTMKDINVTKTLYVKSESGSIIMKKAIINEDLTLKSPHGGIELSGLKGTFRNIELETNNRAITFDQIDFKMVQSPSSFVVTAESGPISGKVKNFVGGFKAHSNLETCFVRGKNIHWKRNTSSSKEGSIGEVDEGIYRLIANSNSRVDLQFESEGGDGGDGDEDEDEDEEENE
ncbi:hypothetical protein HDU97_002199 [Phlyctochytrium planicorne]|nr:hypothetical protein HDU97_002199 [Phlyctochytrium planicorne]